jgi:two-component system NtrC family sensor kinase
MAGEPLQSDDATAAVPTKPRSLRAQDSVLLSRTILHSANRGLPRMDFLLDVSDVLLEFSGCDAVEVRLSDGDLHYRWEASRRPDNAVAFELARWTIDQHGAVIPVSDDPSGLEQICRCVACRELDASLPFFTNNGSFWSGNTAVPLTAASGAEEAPILDGLALADRHKSLAIIRFFVDERTVGLLHLKSERQDYFSEQDIEFYEGVAQTLGLAVADRRAEAAHRERIKELTCLYGIAQVVEQRNVSQDDMLRQIVHLLPPAWQYPDIAAARIVLDDQEYVTPKFRESRYELSSEIVIAGSRRGNVQVVYVEERLELTVGAFLPEERTLIDAVARDIANIVERKEAETERSKLRDQLVHADRLATIGQLAAGVAHELNEPLGSILGFAQLAEKCPGLPEQAERDVKKIINASLYAREVIKKLMVFARQMPPKIVEIDLNRAIDDGLLLLEGRCQKAGIRVECDLAPDLPKIAADLAQLNQVFVNLVVNAVQAMPDGGTLRICTRTDGPAVTLAVEDTGIGMAAEIQDKIFLPFFTTKEITEGTGLGLAVVHGIVTAHGGSIDVHSRPGRGTKFRIRLPIGGVEAATGSADDA